MFDVSAANLHREKENAATYVESLLQTLEDRRRRYHGPHYKGWRLEGDRDAYDPEAVAFDFIGLMLPRLVPPTRAKMSTRRPAAQRDAVMALEFFLNRWMVDSDYQELREEVATDYCLGWMVMMAALEPQPGYVEHDDPLLWPKAMRISPKDFIFDPLAKSVKECRFLGHRIVADKESLERRARENPEEGWNAELLEGLGSNLGVDHLDRGGGEGAKAVDRREIVYWEIWVPEHQLERFPDWMPEDDRRTKAKGPTRKDGYHGTIFTIAEAQDHGDEGGDESEASPDAAYLRPPRPYFGPRWGMYSMVGTYYVPEEVAPLSPLVATQEQIKDLNKLTRAANHNDTQYKRLVLVDSRNPRLAQQLKQEPDSFVIPVRGFQRDHVEVIELGGSTQQQHIAIERSRGIVHRSLGMDDAQRGAVTGVGTATEHTIAAEAGENRVAHIVGRFKRGEEQILKTVAWYAYHVDRVIMPLGSDAEDAFGIQDPVFLGGTFEEGSGATFDDLGLELEATPAGAAQQRALQAYQMVPQVAAALIQLPHLKGRVYLKGWAEAMGVPEIEQMIDYDVLAQLQQQQPPGDPADMQPRLASDLGQLGTIRRMVKTAPAPGAGPPPGPGAGQEPVKSPAQPAGAA